MLGGSESEHDLKKAQTERKTNRNNSGTDFQHETV